MTRLARLEELLVVCPALDDSREARRFLFFRERVEVDPDAHAPLGKYGGVSLAVHAHQHTPATALSVPEPAADLLPEQTVLFGAQLRSAPLRDTFPPRCLDTHASRIR
jgi:hypothetical protein